MRGSRASTAVVPSRGILMLALFAAIGCGGETTEPRQVDVSETAAPHSSTDDLTQPPRAIATH